MWESHVKITKKKSSTESKDSHEKVIRKPLQKYKITIRKYWGSQKKCEKIMRNSWENPENSWKNL